MSDLTDLRDHARERANWQPGPPGVACRERTTFGSPKPPDHEHCGGHNCGCECHRPTAKECQMWTQITDEIDAYLAPDDDGPRLFEEED